MRKAPALLALSTEEGATSQGVQAAGKARKQVFPLEPLEGTESLRHLDVSLVTLIGDFRLPEL